MKAKQIEELLRTLKNRFEKNINRHKGLDWTKVQARQEANSGKLQSLFEMERTGGEPDVISYTRKPESVHFVIVQPKVQQVEEVFAMIVKLWYQGNKIDREVMLLIWRPQWVLRF